MDGFDNGFLETLNEEFYQKELETAEKESLEYFEYLKNDVFGGVKELEYTQ